MEQQTKDQVQGQPYYTPTILAEKTSDHPGRVEGIFSIICAVVSILFFPVIFGPVGIVLGVQSRKKGDKTLGLVGIILSSVFMVAGFILGFLTALEEERAIEGAVGLMLR